MDKKMALIVLLAFKLLGLLYINNILLFSLY